MKMTIKWHEECLRNMQRTWVEYSKAADRALEDARRLEQDIRMYITQISIAKQRGLDSFDRDRLGSKRGKK